MSGPDHHDDSIPTDGTDDDFAREIGLIASLAADPVELTDAPPELWARIAAAAGVDDTAGLGDLAARPADDPESARPDLVVVAPLAPEPPVLEPADPGTSTPEPATPEPVVLEHRRRRWSTVLISAAAVVALLVGVGVFAANRSEPTPTELAAAELLPYQGAQVGEAGGQVELIDDGDQLSLRVDMRDLPTPAPGTFYELWLIDPSTGEPVSVATMKDGSSDVATDVALPAGTDTDRYAVVDVSVQEDGAGPAHSGNSVLRGTLA